MKISGQGVLCTFMSCDSGEVITYDGLTIMKLRTHMQTTCNSVNLLTGALGFVGDDTMVQLHPDAEVRLNSPE